MCFYSTGCAHFLLCIHHHFGAIRSKLCSTAHQTARHHASDDIYPITTVHFMAGSAALIARLHAIKRYGFMESIL